MNAVLREMVKQADGRYLNDEELQPFEEYTSSFVLRFNTYNLLQEHSQQLILQTLRRLIQTHRKTVQENGDKCQRDMAYTLGCVAKAILFNDTPGYIEGYVLWMQNITRALHKQDSAVEAYRLLQTEIEATLPADSARLVNDHLDSLVVAFATDR